jgi:RNA polymerase sigma-70 factor (ECF subfamily)
MPDSRDQKIAERERNQGTRPGEEAFEELFFSYYPKLFVFVQRYVLSRDVADDIVKDLFIDLWQQRERRTIHTSLKAYLYAAARNRALNFLRSNKTRMQHFPLHTIEDEELALVRSRSNNPLETLEKKELGVAVQKAIEALPGRCRLVLTLHWQDGLRYSEIAQVMEISVKTVENHMARAFRLLYGPLSRFISVLLFSSFSALDSIVECCSGL